MICGKIVQVLNLFCIILEVVNNSTMLSSLLLVLICIAGVYFYQKSYRTKQTDLPEKAHNFFEKEVFFYQNLEENQKPIFRKKVAKLLNEIYIEAVNFFLTEEDRWLVGASGVIPVFCFDNWKYPNLSTVIIYPDHFDEQLNFEGENRRIAGMVGTGRYENQMLLSRKALHHGFQNKTDKGNTAIHEFVHLIDKMDGDVDGIPKILLKKHSYTIPWLDMIHHKMEAINNDNSDIRNYGGTSKIEFFAVAAEYFFERPKLLKRKHPELYKMMKNCFCSVSS